MGVYVKHVSASMHRVSLMFGSWALSSLLFWALSFPQPLGASKGSQKTADQLGTLGVSWRPADTCPPPPPLKTVEGTMVLEIIQQKWTLPFDFMVHNLPHPLGSTQRMSREGLALVCF